MVRRALGSQLHTSENVAKWTNASPSIYGEWDALALSIQGCGRWTETLGRPGSGPFPPPPDEVLGITAPGPLHLNYPRSPHDDA